MATIENTACEDGAYGEEEALDCADPGDGAVGDCGEEGC